LLDWPRSKNLKLETGGRKAGSEDLGGRGVVAGVAAGSPASARLRRGESLTRGYFLKPTVGFFKWREQCTCTIEPARALAAETLALERTRKGKCRTQNDRSCGCYCPSPAKIGLRSDARHANEESLLAESPG
jgi:hypothetical protein